jgi:hypothetical protein
VLLGWLLQSAETHYDDGGVVRRSGASRLTAILPMASGSNAAPTGSSQRGFDFACSTMGAK